MDEYAIERVGLLFPRHGAQVSRPISELIAQLSDGDDLELLNLRQ